MGVGPDRVVLEQHVLGTLSRHVRLDVEDVEGHLREAVALDLDASGGDDRDRPSGRSTEHVLSWMLMSSDPDKRVRPIGLELVTYTQSPQVLRIVLLAISTCLAPKIVTPMRFSELPVPPPLLYSPVGLLPTMVKPLIVM